MRSREEWENTPILAPFKMNKDTFTYVIPSGRETRQIMTSDIMLMER